MKFKINKSATIILVILLLFVSVFAVSFSYMYYYDHKTNTSHFTLSYVKLGNPSSVEQTINLESTLPGEELLSAPISVSRDSNSDAFFVRAKLSFAYDSNLTNEEKIEIAPIITQFRQDCTITMDTNVQNGAIWSNKDGNYFYLLSNLNNTNAFSILSSDNTVFNFISSILLPNFDLSELSKNYNIKFTLALQAIQSENVSNNIDDVKLMFNELFPETLEENYNEVFQTNINLIAPNNTVGNVTLANGENITSKTYKVGDSVTLYAVPQEGYDFIGWSYTDGGATFSSEPNYTFIVSAMGNCNVYPIFEEQVTEVPTLTIGDYTIKCGDFTLLNTDSGATNVTFSLDENYNYAIEYIFDESNVASNNGILSLVDNKLIDSAFEITTLDNNKISIYDIENGITTTMTIS